MANVVYQRAKPATKREMTQFHSDEYVEFLSRITPSNMNSYVKEQHKCMFLVARRRYIDINIPQITLEMIVQFSMGYLNIVLFRLEGPWVRPLLSFLIVSYY